MKYLYLLLISITCSINLHSQPIELGKDLVANYLFSGNAQDVSTYLNHGSVNGPILTQDRFGIVASAYYFDGEDDYIEVSDADILSFPGQKTSIALWMKTVRSSHSYMVYKGSKPINRQYAIGINNDRDIASQVINPGALAGLGVFSSTALELNEWYHLTMTWDGRYISIFINGILENRNEGAVSVESSNSNLYFGSYGGENSLDAFPGIIDDINIYKRVKNDCEIKALYSGQEFIQRL